MSDKLKSYLAEHTLFADASSKAAFVADKEMLADAFWCNVLGFLGLYQVNKDFPALKTYLKSDQVRLQNITDQNKDFTYILKLMVDEKVIAEPLMMEFTRLLAILKLGTIASIDENRIRDLFNRMRWRSFLPSAILRRPLQDFMEGKIGLQATIDDVYKFSKRTKRNDDLVAIARRMMPQIDDDPSGQPSQLNNVTPAIATAVAGSPTTADDLKRKRRAERRAARKASATAGSQMTTQQAGPTPNNATKDGLATAIGARPKTYTTFKDIVDHEQLGDLDTMPKCAVAFFRSWKAGGKSSLNSLASSWKMGHALSYSSFCQGMVSSLYRNSVPSYVNAQNDDLGRRLVAAIWPGGMNPNSDWASAHTMSFMQDADFWDLDKMNNLGGQITEMQRKMLLEMFVKSRSFKANNSEHLAAFAELLCQKEPTFMTSSSRPVMSYNYAVESSVKVVAWRIREAFESEPAQMFNAVMGIPDKAGNHAQAFASSANVDWSWRDMFIITYVLNSVKRDSEYAEKWRFDIFKLTVDKFGIDSKRVKNFYSNKPQFAGLGVVKDYLKSKGVLGREPFTIGVDVSELQDGPELYESMKFRDAIFNYFFKNNSALLSSETKTLIDGLILKHGSRVKVVDKSGQWTYLWDRYHNGSGIKLGDNHITIHDGFEYDPEVYKRLDDWLKTKSDDICSVTNVFYPYLESNVRNILGIIVPKVGDTKQWRDMCKTAILRTPGEMLKALNGCNEPENFRFKQWLVQMVGSEEIVKAVKACGLKAMTEPNPDNWSRAFKEALTSKAFAGIIDDEILLSDYAQSIMLQNIKGNNSSSYYGPSNMMTLFFRTNLMYRKSRHLGLTGERAAECIEILRNMFNKLKADQYSHDAARKTLHALFNMLPTITGPKEFVDYVRDELSKTDLFGERPMRKKMQAIKGLHDMLREENNSDKQFMTDAEKNAIDEKIKALALDLKGTCNFLVAEFDLAHKTNERQHDPLKIKYNYKYMRDQGMLSDRFIENLGDIAGSGDAIREVLDEYIFPDDGATGEDDDYIKFKNMLVGMTASAGSPFPTVLLDIKENSGDYDAHASYHVLMSEFASQATSWRGVSRKTIENEIMEYAGDLLFNVYNDKDMRSHVNTIIGKFEACKKHKQVYRRLKDKALVGPIINDIMSADTPIRPEIKMTDKDIQQALRWNNFEVTDSMGKAITKKAKESYSDFIGRVVGMKGVVSTANMPKLNATDSSKSKLELEEMTAEYGKYYSAGFKHGNTGLEFIRTFDVNMVADEFTDFKTTKGNLGKIEPAFHGTGTLAAAMILRFGFKILKDAKSGRMLGHGIYFSNILDKAAQYCGDAGYTRSHGSIGYVFEMEAYPGKNGEDHRSAGLSGDHIRSPEWCVFNPRAQLRIYKAHKVKICPRTRVEQLMAKHAKAVNERKHFGYGRFQEFINEELETKVKEETYKGTNTVHFVFMEGTIPVSRQELVEFETFRDLVKDKTNISVEESADGPVVVIQTKKDMSGYIMVDDTDVFAYKNPEGLCDRFLLLVGKLPPLPEE